MSYDRYDALGSQTGKFAHKSLDVKLKSHPPCTLLPLSVLTKLTMASASSGTEKFGSSKTPVGLTPTKDLPIFAKPLCRKVSNEKPKSIPVPKVSRVVRRRLSGIPSSNRVTDARMQLATPATQHKINQVTNQYKFGTAKETDKLGRECTDTAVYQVHEQNHRQETNRSGEILPVASLALLNSCLGSCCREFIDAMGGGSQRLQLSDKENVRPFHSFYDKSRIVENVAVERSAVSKIKPEVKCSVAEDTEQHRERQNHSEIVSSDTQTVVSNVVPATAEKSGHVGKEDAEITDGLITAKIPKCGEDCNNTKKMLFDATSEIQASPSQQCKESSVCPEAGWHPSCVSTLSDLLINEEPSLMISKATSTRTMTCQSVLNNSSVGAVENSSDKYLVTIMTVEQQHDLPEDSSPRSLQQKTDQVLCSDNGGKVKLSLLPITVSSRYQKTVTACQPLVLSQQASVSRRFGSLTSSNAQSSPLAQTLIQLDLPDDCLITPGSFPSTIKDELWDKQDILGTSSGRVATATSSELSTAKAQPLLSPRYSNVDTNSTGISLRMPGLRLEMSGFTVNQLLKQSVQSPQVLLTCPNKFNESPKKCEVGSQTKTLELSANQTAENSLSSVDDNAKRIDDTPEMCDNILQGKGSRETAVDIPRTPRESKENLGISARLSIIADRLDEITDRLIEVMIGPRLEKIDESRKRLDHDLNRIGERLQQIDSSIKRIEEKPKRDVKNTEEAAWSCATESSPSSHSSNTAVPIQPNVVLLPTIVADTTSSFDNKPAVSIHLPCRVSSKGAGIYGTQQNTRRCYNSLKSMPTSSPTTATTATSLFSPKPKRREIPPKVIRHEAGARFPSAGDVLSFFPSKESLDLLMTNLSTPARMKSEYRDRLPTMHGTKLPPFTPTFYQSSQDDVGEGSRQSCTRSPAGPLATNVLDETSPLQAMSPPMSPTHASGSPPFSTRSIAQATELATNRIPQLRETSDLKVCQRQTPVHSDRDPVMYMSPQTGAVFDNGGAWNLPNNLLGRYSARQNNTRELKMTEELSRFSREVHNGDIRASVFVTTPVAASTLQKRQSLDGLTRSSERGSFSPASQITVQNNVGESLAATGVTGGGLENTSTSNKACQLLLSDDMLPTSLQSGVVSNPTGVTPEQSCTPVHQSIVEPCRSATTSPMQNPPNDISFNSQNKLSPLKDEPSDMSRTCSTKLRRRKTQDNSWNGNSSIASQCTSTPDDNDDDDLYSSSSKGRNSSTDVIRSVQVVYHNCNGMTVGDNRLSRRERGNLGKTGNAKDRAKSSRIMPRDLSSKKAAAQFEGRPATLEHLSSIFWQCC